MLDKARAKHRPYEVFSVFKQKTWELESLLTRARNITARLLRHPKTIGILRRKTPFNNNAGNDVRSICFGRGRDIRERLYVRTENNRHFEPQNTVYKLYTVLMLTSQRRNAGAQY
jgi:hypothetical protein